MTAAGPTVEVHEQITALVTELVYVRARGTDPSLGLLGQLLEEAVAAGGPAFAELAGLTVTLLERAAALEHRRPLELFRSLASYRRTVREA